MNKILFLFNIPMAKLGIVFVLVHLIALVLSFGDELGDGIFKKYATIKIYEDCYGKQTVQDMFSEIRSAAMKCSGKSTAAAVPMAPSIDFTQLLKQQLKPNSPQQLAMPQPMRPQNDIPPFASRPLPYQYDVYYPYFGYPNQFNGYYPNELPFRHRSVRETAEKEEKADPMKAADVQMQLKKFEQLLIRIQNKINNMTCVLQELNFLDADKKPNYPGIKERINRLPISEDIKNDLCDGLDMCRDFSSCLPVKKLGSPVVEDLAQPFVFFKCFRTRKLTACMKRDLQEKLGFAADEGLAMARRMVSTDADYDPESLTSNMIKMIFGYDYSSDMDIF